jgi:hypothetical protein
MVHNGKTKIMSNIPNHGWKGGNDFEVNGRPVRVMPIYAVEKYLGRAFSFQDAYDGNQTSNTRWVG